MAQTVVVLGKGTLAIRVAAWFRRSSDWRLAAVVPVMPEPRWTRSLVTWARKHHVPVIGSGRVEDLEAVIGQASTIRPGATCDLAVSVFYDHILRPAFLDSVVRTINVHNGPLPRYRGVAPINWALKQRETSHGVTIHDVTPGIDDGPVLGQATFSIYPEFDEVIDVYQRALRYGWLTFLETIPRLRRITPRPQGPGATYYTGLDRALLGERLQFTIAESLGLTMAGEPAQDQRIRA